MTDLPPGWARTTIGDLLLAIEAGKSFRCEARPARPEEWGIIKVSAMTWGEFRETENKAVQSNVEIDPANEVKPGDILLSRANTEAYVGASVLVGECRPRLLLSDKSLRLVPSSLVDRRWFAYLLSSPGVRREISRRATGTKDSMRNISQASLREIQVLVPPIAEQRRIVAALEDHLSRIERGTAQLTGLVQRIERFRDSLMAAACTGRLVGGPYADTPADEPTPANSVDGDLPEIPGHWRWARLGEIAEVVGGVTKDSKKQNDPTLPEVPYLRVANVQRGRLDLSTVTYIRVPEQKARQLELQRGDVLLNEGGDRDKLGRGWIWEGQIPGCIHQNHVFRARIRNGVLHPKLLAWHANGFGKRWCEVNGKQSVNLASISLSMIKLLPVPLPPFEEQERLVTEAEQYLTLLDNTEQVARAALSRAHKLRRALLAEAFAGRLVEQDPADEPASVLLERIRAERAARKPVQQGRRSKNGTAPQKETSV